MSKAEILSILNKNKNSYLSAEEISKILSINVQSVYSSLKKLVMLNEIKFKEFKKKGVPSKKLYYVPESDKYLDQVMSSLNGANLPESLLMVNKDTIVNIMILAELKKLNDNFKGNK